MEFEELICDPGYETCINCGTPLTPSCLSDFCTKKCEEEYIGAIRENAEFDALYGIEILDREIIDEREPH